jgi:hypothetical protein
MNDDFNYDYMDENDLYESMMETGPEDWLPIGGVQEQFDPETLALLKSF